MMPGSTLGAARQTACVAGVLVGGRSRRMGTCKALANFRGKTFAQHTAELAAKVAEEDVWLGDAEIVDDGLPRLARLPDAPFGSGPLRGLHSLLEFAGRRWALLLACDMPLLSVDVLARLVAECNDHVDAVAFQFRCISGRAQYHACCAAYHPRALAAVRAELIAGTGRIQSVLHSVRCKGLRPTADEEERLVNVNTADELTLLNARNAGA